jgi:CRP-like cAMP-binding protein
VLHEAHETQRHVFFPTTAIVSLLYVLENGAAAEIAVVGDDGIVGVPLFMGGQYTTSRAVVQSAGQAFQLKAQLLMDEFNRNGPVLHLLLRYTQALITQMAQTAVCNRHHSLDQQLCRWLLLSLDRLEGIDLVMTQELIANMLGVRREPTDSSWGSKRSQTDRGNAASKWFLSKWDVTMGVSLRAKSGRRPVCLCAAQHWKDDITHYDVRSTYCNSRRHRTEVRGGPKSRARLTPACVLSKQSDDAIRRLARLLKGAGCLRDRHNAAWVNRHQLDVIETGTVRRRD